MKEKADPQLAPVSEPQSSSVVSVDRVTLPDLPAIIAIDLDITGSEKPEYWYGLYAANQSDANSPFLAAHVDGEVVGYIVGSFRAWEFGSPRCGWVHAIGVKPDSRKLGVATKLFVELARHLMAAGATTIRTMIHIDNQVLMSFFRFQGMAAGPFIELEMSLDALSETGRDIA